MILAENDTSYMWCSVLIRPLSSREDKLQKKIYISAQKHGVNFGELFWSTW